MLAKIQYFQPKFIVEIALQIFFRKSLNLAFSLRSVKQILALNCSPVTAAWAQMGVHCPKVSILLYRVYGDSRHSMS